MSAALDQRCRCALCWPAISSATSRGLSPAGNSTGAHVREGGTMTVKLNPYLNFRDNAREALEFYHSVFGGELRMSTFKEYQAAQDPAEENLIMHGQLEGDHDVTLMASDLPKSMEYKPGGSFS